MNVLKSWSVAITLGFAALSLSPEAHAFGSKKPAELQGVVGRMVPGQPVIMHQFEAGDLVLGIYEYEDSSARLGLWSVYPNGDLSRNVSIPVNGEHKIRTYLSKALDSLLVVVDGKSGGGFVIVGQGAGYNSQFDSRGSFSHHVTADGIHSFASLSSNSLTLKVIGPGTLKGRGAFEFAPLLSYRMRLPNVGGRLISVRASSLGAAVVTVEVAGETRVYSVPFGTTALEEFEPAILPAPISSLQVIEDGTMVAFLERPKTLIASMLSAEGQVDYTREIECHFPQTLESCAVSLGNDRINQALSLLRDDSAPIAYPSLIDFARSGSKSLALEKGYRVTWDRSGSELKFIRPNGTVKRTIRIDGRVNSVFKVSSSRLTIVSFGDDPQTLNSVGINRVFLDLIDIKPGFYGS